jgi:hypothetical protein
MLVLVIWTLLFLISAFGPLRWSVFAFLVLSLIDFEGGLNGVAVFNIAKGILLPAFLLWRMRRYSGHNSVTIAPIAWLLLMCYVGVASTWSFFPDSAHKLVVQMFGSFMIACVYMRAAKAKVISAGTAVGLVPVCLVLGLLRGHFYPDWGDGRGRFTTFTSAQEFAAFLAALYCIILCGKGLRTPTRAIACCGIAAMLIMDGSRIWFVGVVIGTLLSLLLSRGQVWLKICAAAVLVCMLTTLVAASDYFFQYMQGKARTNRIASTVTAIHQGNPRGVGLGTFDFRQQINEIATSRIRSSDIGQLVFGRGTCNGALITAAISASYAHFPDPNRMFHDEWLRVIYEWGLIGSVLWLLMFGSIIQYAIKGVAIDPGGNAKPLLIYLPSFMIGLAGENFIAGAGHAANMGFIFAIALSTAPHRDFLAWRAAKAARKSFDNRFFRAQALAARA